MIGERQCHIDLLLGQCARHIGGQHHKAVRTAGVQGRLKRIRAAHWINRDRTLGALRLDRIGELIPRIDVGCLDRTSERHILRAGCSDLRECRARGGSKEWRIVARRHRHVDGLLSRGARRIRGNDHKTVGPAEVVSGFVAVSPRGFNDRDRALCCA